MTILALAMLIAATILFLIEAVNTRSLVAAGLTLASAALAIMAASASRL